MPVEFELIVSWTSTNLWSGTEIRGSFDVRLLITGKQDEQRRSARVERRFEILYYTLYYPPRVESSFYLRQPRRLHGYCFCFLGDRSFRKRGGSSNDRRDTFLSASFLRSFFSEAFWKSSKKMWKKGIEKKLTFFSSFNIWFRVILFFSLLERRN